MRFSIDAGHIVSLPEGAEIITRKENYSTGIYVHSVPDFAEMFFLAHLLRPGDLFVDVGANIGMYSIWVSHATGASTLALDPVPGTFETLRKNIRLNDLEALIESLRTAVGDVAGDVLMTSNKGGLDHIVQKQVEGAIQVPVARIDDLLIGRCPFAMKIDVEGFELQALRGAAATLRDRRLKAIIIELADWILTRYGTSAQEVRSLLESRGFHLYNYDPFNRTLAPIIAHRGLNAIFIRENDDEISRRLSSGRKIPVSGYPSGI
jgi:FkbM family methyltransferase